MGPIQQSLNSITTTAMDAIRTKEALASQHEREQRDVAANQKQALEEQASKELQEYSKGNRGEFSKEVLPKIFNNEQNWAYSKLIQGRQNKAWQNYNKEHYHELRDMSKEDKQKLKEDVYQNTADKYFFEDKKYASQETYQMSRLFDTMNSMIEGNKYAQQAAIQLSDKIDTALNHMQSRKRWR